MFESAEIGRSIDKDTYDAEAPALREALLEAQYELQQQGRFAVLILIDGIEGAGKGETVKLLNEWMDARLIQVSTFDQQTDEELARPPARPRGAIGGNCRPRGASASFLVTGTARCSKAGCMAGSRMLCWISPSTAPSAWSACSVMRAR